ncbi:hypothetical protein [Clostridium sp.]|uniref:hypothetical protein n=1 Tax=Clostridium sp. TaxID=1506 RepID=UPI003D6D21D7
MNNNKGEKLSTILYRYMKENEDKIIYKSLHYKNEKKIEMDDNFKERLKEHFRTLASKDNNIIKCHFAQSI